MSSFINKIVDLEENEVQEILEEKLQKNEDPLKIMDEVKEAMKLIGDRYQNKEYFLPDLIMSGEILRDVFEKLAPLLKDKQKEEIKKGKVLLGTVKGDIHDIGKDVVKFMLDANGFDVLDLGVDVAADTFIENLKEFQPQVLALSGFLTLAFDSMKEIIAKLEDQGLRDSVKIMIGGGTIDESIVQYVKADAYGESAVDAVNLAKKWVEA
ncbi:MAG: methionine synthase [Candidatus Lokiarchaeota archaeon]|nr:methionine synthase [Candidatus Lokiarchaeota archaeon]MBD3201109.1 methionine synthase [Candidatus Lokiarchaeota archaeon]